MSKFCSKKLPKQDYIEIALSETLDYIFDFTKTLDLVSPSDTVTGSSWVVTGNGTLSSPGFNTTRTWTWLVPSGAARIGNVIRIKNTVTTAGGRTHVRILILKVTNRQALAPDLDVITLETPV